MKFKLHVCTHILLPCTQGKFSELSIRKHVNILTKWKLTVLTLIARQRYYRPQQRHRWHSIHFSDRIPCEVSRQGRSSAQKTSLTITIIYDQTSLPLTQQILFMKYFNFFLQWPLLHRKGSRYRCGLLVKTKLWCFCVLSIIGVSIL